MTKAGDSGAITREYYDSIVIEESFIDSYEPDLSIEIFGKKFKTPIMSAALSHLPVMGEGRRNGMVEYAEATKNVGAVNFMGMSTNEAFGEVLDVNKDTVRIIKSYADKDKVFSRLKFAEENGALAVGMDVMHVFSRKGRYDNVVGEQLGPLSMNDLGEYIKYTKLPFVVKDVLGVKDAVKSAELGANAILISHHHGIMDFAIPPIMILPEIVKEVGGKVKIIVDCNVESGLDAYKALALGADAVCVGRPIMAALKDGVAGVEEMFEQYNNQLRQVMASTGCANVSKITADVLWNRYSGKRLVDR